MPTTFQEYFKEAGGLKNGPATDRARAVALLGTAFTNLRLDLTEFAKAAKLIDQLAALPDELPGIRRVKVLLAGERNTSHMGLAIRTALTAVGTLVELREAPLGAWRQTLLEALERKSPWAPDIIMLDPWGPDIPGPPLSASAGETSAFAIRTAAGLRAYQDVALTIGARLFLHTACGLPHGLTGPLERTLPAAPARFRETLNAALADSLPSHVSLVDTAAAAESCGLRQWYDERYRFHGKFPFGPTCLDAYARAVLATYRAVCGPIPKVLVLDLDNTLWGGVVGDDGLEGIKLGPETAEGDAHHAFCRYVLDLRERGVLLAVCSKNEVSLAREVFEHHPHMPIKWPQFAAVRCNWQDKAANLRELAQELNVGLDSLVFVDDNPVERVLVRAALPSVTVVELPPDPSRYIRALDDLKLFVATRLTGEDLERSALYERRREFEHQKQEATDVGAFLTGLGMKASFAPARLEDLPRLAQLEAKTNQFNLTTRRFSETELRGLLDDEASWVFAGHLSDDLGHHGLVTSVVARVDSDTLQIVSWLMSCRVFSRTLEHFVINLLVQHAANQGLTHLSATHFPTAKNALLSTTLSELGFERQETIDGATTWRLAVTSPSRRTYVSVNPADQAQCGTLATSRR